MWTETLLNLAIFKTTSAQPSIGILAYAQQQQQQEVHSGNPDFIGIG